MSVDLEKRYIRRYEESVSILEKNAESMYNAIQNNFELAEFSNRLLLTPPIIWDCLFASGLNRELFWEKALEAFEFTTKWNFASLKLTDLTEACDPENRRVTDIPLNNIIYGGDASFHQILGHVKDKDQSLQRLPNMATDIVLPAVSTEDVPLARYQLRFIKGKGKLPFDDLVDGGVQYHLPTSLEAVQATLTYPREAQSPIVSLRVKPLN